MQKAMTTTGLSFNAFNKELQKAGTSTTKLLSDLAGGGATFSKTFE